MRRYFFASLMIHLTITGIVLFTSLREWLYVLLIYGIGFLVPTFLLVYIFNLLLSEIGVRYYRINSLPLQSLLCAVVLILMFVLAYLFGMKDAIDSQQYHGILLYILIVSAIVGAWNYFVVTKRKDA